MQQIACYGPNVYYFSQVTKSMDGVVKGLDKAMASMDLEKVLYLHFLKTYGHSRLQGPFFEKSPFGNLHMQNGCHR